MASLSFKQDNIRFGMILGFLAPFLGIIIYYFYRFFPTFSFSEYLSVFRNNKPLLTGISSISLIINIALFTIYNNTRRDRTARGIFILTLIYGLCVLLFKFIA